jgi:hypothetical protein
MFSYNHDVLADVVWSDYIAVKKENFDLLCQLETAKQTVEFLRGEIRGLSETIKDLQPDADESVDGLAEPELER